MKVAMRSQAATLALLLSLTSGVVACHDEAAPAPAPTPEEPRQPVAAPTQAPAPEAVADEAPLAVIEDFEAEVEQAITTDNYKTELAALEQELTP